ncbi:MAG TPA: hypothetical protein VGR62_14035 [Candidatus Binatia bacterium]|jgi:hypothetical protein|nr:hypothetical protein [Candidatus Binatia bacterium]
MSIDTTFLERFLLGGLLAFGAIGIAFGPELRRFFQRLRGRSPMTGDARSVSAETQTS